MSRFTRIQARQVAQLNAEAARLIAEGRWTSEAFCRLRTAIQAIAPDFGDAQSQIIRYARPEWIEGLDDVATVRGADATIGASDRHASLTVFERLDALRLREAQGTLSREERDELDGLYARLDEEDRARLGSGEEGLLEEVLRDAESLQMSADASPTTLAMCRTRLQGATLHAVERERRYAHDDAA